MTTEDRVVQLVGAGRVERIRGSLETGRLGLQIRWAPTLDAALEGVEGVPGVAPPGIFVLDALPEGPWPPRVIADLWGDPAPLLVVAPEGGTPAPSLPERGAELVIPEGWDAEAIEAVLAGLLHAFARLEDYERRIRRQVRFLEAVAHDLRGPIAAVQGYAELVREAIGPEHGELAADVERILDNAGALKDLAVEISAVVSEAETGMFSTLETIDAADLLALVVDAARPAAEGRGVRLAFEAGPEHVLALGQKGQLRRVFSNLIENAVKFSPEGGRVGARVSRDGDAVRIEVEDEGPGIPPAFREAVFRRRIRLGSGPAGGEGLGLAIVREIVDLHGGEVWIEDGPSGRGSRFVVQLPSQQGPAVERIDAPHGAVEIAETPGGVALRFEGALEAEDVERVRNRILAVLDRREGAVTVDLERLERASSRGVALLLELKLEAASRGLAFELGAVSEAIASVLARSQLGELFGLARSGP